MIDYAEKRTRERVAVFPWGTHRPYNAYKDYLKTRFGGRLQKVSVDAGFTCPNRDGSKAFGGCTYCNNLSFVPPYCKPGMSIGEQVGGGDGSRQVDAGRIKAHRSCCDRGSVDTGERSGGGVERDGSGAGIDVGVGSGERDAESGEVQVGVRGGNLVRDGE